MWLTSFRLIEVMAYDHPLKVLRPELRLHGLCEEIVLDPFSEQEVASYVAERAPSMAGDNELVRALHEHTDGLPLFVTHVVDQLARGKLGAADAPRALRLERLAMPENLAGIIEHQVSRLAPEQLLVLEAAAICGLKFRVGTLAAVLSREPAWVASICEELARGHVWLNAAADHCGCALDPPYIFRHALVRQWLCERIGPMARTLLEAKVAVALQREQPVGVPLFPAEPGVHCEPTQLAACGAVPRSVCPFHAVRDITVLERTDTATR
jgi:predicted ATPase